MAVGIHIIKRKKIKRYPHFPFSRKIKDWNIYLIYKNISLRRVQIEVSECFQTLNIEDANLHLKFLNSILRSYIGFTSVRLLETT